LIGVSFSARRCASLGLASESAFLDVLALGFGVVRISAYWDQIRRDGYDELDWLMDAARDAGQALVLTVGMKGIRWPEFYIPPELQPWPRRDEVLAFVSETVARYRDRREVIAWQVENEPFNRSGPRHRWIHPRLVRSEMRCVRSLDERPIVLNAFAHFDVSVDDESRPRRLFGLVRVQPEKLILDLLGPFDVLGLDVYTAIADRAAALDWSDSAARWLRVARERGHDAWIIEAQAEPWKTPSFSPDDMRSIYASLARAGFSTILLWGVEHWLERAAAGDTTWLDAAKRLVDPRGSAGCLR
jgi:hypothetical protein